MIGTSNPQQEHYMKLSSLGSLSIEVTATSANPEIMNVDIGAQNRKDTISMQTNKDETVDQFCGRVRSMLRALMNCEQRQTDGDKKDDKKAIADKKAQTWDEQKAAMKEKGQTPTVAPIK